MNDFALSSRFPSRIARTIISLLHFVYTPLPARFGSPPFPFSLRRRVSTAGYPSSSRFARRSLCVRLFAACAFPRLVEGAGRLRRGQRFADERLRGGKERRDRDRGHRCRCIHIHAHPHDGHDTTCVRVTAALTPAEADAARLVRGGEGEEVVGVKEERRGRRGGERDRHHTHASRRVHQRRRSSTERAVASDRTCSVISPAVSLPTSSLFNPSRSVSHSLSLYSAVVSVVSEVRRIATR